MAFTIHSIYRQVFKIWRKRRFQLFLTIIEPKRSDKLLDVGGYPTFWTSYPPAVHSIDSLNVHEVDWNAAEAPEHAIQTLVGDGWALPMSDQSYDIGFSNSVIEHVGTWEQQQKFAIEIRRVAKSLWVQTPAFECPIEPHYMTPLVHYLPRSVQRWGLRWCSVWGWVQRPNADEVKFMVDTTRLLKKSEVRELFPDCEILTERMLGFIPKSYIAVRRSA